MSENRAAWVRTATGVLAYQRYLPGEEDHDKELGPNIVLYIPVPGRRPTTINLTAMTLPELEAVKEFLDFIIEEARPVVAERDRIANEAYEQGDDSFVRVYRDAPQLIIRSRYEHKQHQGVPDGSEDVSAGSGGDGSPDHRSRRDGDELVDGEPQPSSTEDDGPTAERAS
jgi:hypothetical protein